MDDTRFSSGSSFVRPEAVREFRELANLRKHHPDSRLSLFAHADPIGSEEDNKTLSGRRAEAIYGLLTGNTDMWRRLYDEPFKSDKWGESALQSMLRALGHADVSAFQKANALPANGSADATTRTKLFAGYMDLLCGNALQLKPADFLGRGTDKGGKGDYHGCGEFNAILRPSKAQMEEFDKPGNHGLRDATLAINRRAVIYFFRAETKIDPAKWPCSRASEGPAACRKRFWSDHKARVATNGSERTYEESQDTFACRFYHRLAASSPCEMPKRRKRLRVYVHDHLGKILANEPYSLEVDGELIADSSAVTDSEGLVDHEVDPGAESAVLKIDRHVWNLTLETPPPHAEEPGVRARMANLGFLNDHQNADDADLDFALWSFQRLAELEKTGRHDQPTIGHLDKLHGFA